MKQYLLSIYQPDGAPPASVNLTQIMKDLAAVNEEMKREGVWVFTNGLAPASTATVVRVDRNNGEVLTVDGPFVEGKEHVGGLYIINAPDLDVALKWGAKVAKASTLPIEVRPFQDHGAH